MTGIDRILELQEVDLSIDRLEARRRDLESGREIAEARRRADEAQDRVGDIRMELDAVGREERRLEGEISSLRQRASAEEKRLYDGSVANPKELSAIQAEIANLKQRTTRLEDEELVHMERREEMERRLPPLEQELAEAQQRLSHIEASTQTELTEIRRALGERRAERDAVVPAIDEELLELYEDLRAQKRGIGAAALRDGVCQGCHEQLSALELDRLKRAEDVRRCPHCRRILVLE